MVEFAVNIRRRPPSGSDGLIVISCYGPVPRQELGESALRHVGDASEDVGEPSLRIDIAELGGDDHRQQEGKRSAPRCEPAKVHERRPRAMPRRLALICPHRKRESQISGKGKLSNGLSGRGCLNRNAPDVKGP